MSNKPSMDPTHPQWDEFIEKLEGPEGCDFQEKVPGDPNSITWKCKGGKNKDLAMTILKKHFPEVDVDASLAFFEQHGGYCDCEILFNVPYCYGERYDQS